MPKRKKDSSRNPTPTKRRRKEDLGDGSWQVKCILAEDDEKGYLLQWEGIDSQTGREYSPEWRLPFDVGEGLIAEWESSKRNGDRAAASETAEFTESAPSTPRRTPRARKPSRRIVESSSPTTAAGSALASARNLETSVSNSPTSETASVGRGRRSRRVINFISSSQNFGPPLPSPAPATQITQDSSARTALEHVETPSPSFEPYVAVSLPSQFNPEDYQSNLLTQYPSSQLSRNSPLAQTPATESPSQASANLEEEESPISQSIASSSRRGSDLDSEPHEVPETQADTLVRRFGDPIEGNTQRVRESSPVSNQDNDIETAASDSQQQSKSTEHESGQLTQDGSIATSSTKSNPEVVPATIQQDDHPTTSTSSNNVSQPSLGPSADEPSIAFTPGTIETSTSEESQTSASHTISDFATQIPFESIQQAEELPPQQTPINEARRNSFEDNGTDRPSVIESTAHLIASTDIPSEQKPVDQAESIAQEITSSVVDRALAAIPNGDSISSPLPPPLQSIDDTGNITPRQRMPSNMSTPRSITPTSSSSQRLSYGQQRALSRLHSLGEPLPDNFPDEWRYLAADPSAIPGRLAQIQEASKRRTYENSPVASKPTSQIHSPAKESTPTENAAIDNATEHNSTNAEALDSSVEKVVTDPPVSTNEANRDLNFYIPLSLVEDQRSLYLDTLRYHMETIKDFLSTEEYSPELLDKVRHIMQQLYCYIVHPDLTDDGSWTQNEETLESRARWSIRMSSKFRLLKTFFDHVEYTPTRVALVAKPGRYIDMVENFMKGIDVTYYRPDQHRRHDSSSGSSMSVTLLRSGPEGARHIESSAHIVIGLDETFNPNDPQVRQVRRQIANHDIMCPAVSLVVVSSVEHVKRRLGNDLSEVEQLQILLTEACKLRKQVGITTEDIPRPHVLGENIAKALLSGGFATFWVENNLPRVEFPSLASVEESESLTIEPAADVTAVNKRHLDEIASPVSGDPRTKRPRTSTLQGDEGIISSSTNRITESNFTSTEVAAVTGVEAEVLKQKISELEAAVDDAGLRVKAADERSLNFEAKWKVMKEHNNSLESSLTDLQTRFENITHEKQSLANQLSISQTKIAGMEANSESLRDNITTLKAERTQLRTELVEARKVASANPLPTASAPADMETNTSDVVSTPAAPVIDHEAAARKAEKRVESLKKELQFFSEQYQAASTSAAEGATTIKALEAERDSLKALADETKLKLRTMYENEAFKRANENIQRLQLENKSLEKAVARSVEENKRLKEKESRLGMAANTRASSLPPGVAPPGLHASVRNALGARGSGGGSGNKSKSGSRQGSRQPSPKPGSNEKVGVGTGSGKGTAAVALHGGVAMARSVSQGSGSTASAKTIGPRIQLNWSRSSHLRE